jgi:tetraacyldisaccharide-1-P 4'-kinase
MRTTNRSCTARGHRTSRWWWIGPRARGRAGAWRGRTVVVLDDAFQHRRLTATSTSCSYPWSAGRRSARLLPRGAWREPPAALERADLIVVCARRHDASLEAVSTSRAAMLHERRPGARCACDLHGCAPPWRGTGAAGRGGADRAGLLVAALAEPGLFATNARAAGATVRTELTFPDHHEYAEPTSRGSGRRQRGDPSSRVPRTGPSCAAAAA